MIALAHTEVEEKKMDNYTTQMHIPWQRGQKVSGSSTFPFGNRKETDKHRGPCVVCKKRTSTKCMQCNVWLHIHTLTTGKTCWGDHHSL